MINDDREALIREHFVLVKKIARRIHRLVPTVEIGDLIGDGSIGLIRAVDQFEPGYGIPLEQYARRLISGAMLNGIRRMDPVPERARRVVRDGETARYRLATERGSLPRDRDLEAIYPGFLRARNAAHQRVPLSLDAPLPEGEYLRADWSEDPAAIVAERARIERVHGALARLTLRQRTVMREHYFAERSLRDVGSDLQISPQRASQLHQTALLRMKKELDATAR